MQQKKIDSLLPYAQSLTHIKQVGKNWLGCCPLHDEKTPSFYVYPDTGKFACYGCDQKGDVLDLYQAATGSSFIEAKKALGFWDNSPNYSPAQAVPKRIRKGQIEFTESNKKEVYLACRYAMISGGKMEVIQDGLHHSFDFEFVWQCINGKIGYVWDLVQRMPGYTGDAFYLYVMDRIGERYAAHGA